MTSSRTWRHPATGTEYPIEWHIEGPGLDISIEPLIDAQALASLLDELKSVNATVSYELRYVSQNVSHFEDGESFEEPMRSVNNRLEAHRSTRTSSGALVEGQLMLR